MAKRATTEDPPSGMPDKRRAILRGALTVFARDGYSRAGIDRICAEAGVSTRTLYNHFGDKASLFQAVMVDSTAEVSDRLIGIIDRHFWKVTDLETDLIAWGRAMVSPMPEYDDHFALVQQINAETAHIPTHAWNSWQAAGPSRVRGELASHLQGLADRGLLRVDDPDRAAFHLMLLISGPLPSPAHRDRRPPEAEVDEIVASGVRAFLHGYATQGRREDDSTRPDSTARSGASGP